MQRKGRLDASSLRRRGALSTLYAALTLCTKDTELSNPIPPVARTLAGLIESIDVIVVANSNEGDLIAFDAQTGEPVFDNSNEDRIRMKNATKSTTSRTTEIQNRVLGVISVPSWRARSGLRALSFGHGEKSTIRPPTSSATYPLRPGRYSGGMTTTTKTSSRSTSRNGFYKDDDGEQGEDEIDHHHSLLLTHYDGSITLLAPPPPPPLVNVVATKEDGEKEEEGRSSSSSSSSTSSPAPSPTKSTPGSPMSPLRQHQHHHHHHLHPPPPKEATSEMTLNFDGIAKNASQLHNLAEFELERMPPANMSPAMILSHPFARIRGRTDPRCLARVSNCHLKIYMYDDFDFLLKRYSTLPTGVSFGAVCEFGLADFGFASPSGLQLTCVLSHPTDPYSVLVAGQGYTVYSLCPGCADDPTRHRRATIPKYILEQSTPSFPKAPSDRATRRLSPGWITHMSLSLDRKRLLISCLPWHLVSVDVATLSDWRAECPIEPSFGTICSAIELDGDAILIASEMVEEPQEDFDAASKKKDESPTTTTMTNLEVSSLVEAASSKEERETPFDDAVARQWQQRLNAPRKCVLVVFSKAIAVLHPRARKWWRVDHNCQLGGGGGVGRMSRRTWYALQDSRREALLQNTPV